MRQRIIFIAAISAIYFLVSSCASGSGAVTILDKSFNPAGTKISLLPPRYKFSDTGTIDIGSEQSVGRTIFNSLEQRTSSQWLSPEESVTLIQDANVLSEYESLLDGYQKTGIPSKTKLLVLSETLKSPYIALCQIDYKVTGVLAESGYRLAGITLQVLSSNDGKVVLEIIGNAQCGSGGYDIGAQEVMQMAIDEAINKYPGAKAVNK